MLFLVVIVVSLSLLGEFSYMNGLVGMQIKTQGGPRVGLHVNTSPRLLLSTLPCRLWPP